MRISAHQNGRPRPFPYRRVAPTEILASSEEPSGLACVLASAQTVEPASSRNPSRQKMHRPSRNPAPPLLRRPPSATNPCHVITSSPKAHPFGGFKTWVFSTPAVLHGILPPSEAPRERRHAAPTLQMRRGTSSSRAALDEAMSATGQLPWQFHPERRLAG